MGTVSKVWFVQNLVQKFVLPKVTMMSPVWMTLAPLPAVIPVQGSDGILDCLTGPCVTVPEVGKLQGTWQKTQWTERREYSFAPPRPKAALNDGKNAFDATYLNYITDWWDHVCPQPGIDKSGKYENPMLAMAAAQDPALDKKMRG